MRLLPLLVASAAAALAACAPEEVAHVDQGAPAALTTTNGDNLNGDNLNGDNLNGPGLGGHVVSVGYSSVTRGTLLLDTVSISGSQLVGTAGSQRFQGADFAGSYLKGLSDTGKDVYLRVESATQDPAPDGDTWSYDVSVYDPVHVSWFPLCTNAGVRVNALALDGTWNYGVGVPGGGAKTVDGKNFTFACRSVGAIGKCASIVGYKPWRTVNGVSLDRHHQACVRLLRADFCGNGQPYTVNGNRVDIYDGIGVQQDTESLWFFEAEWDTNGARCFSPVNRSRSAVPCYQPRTDVSCGQSSHFQGGALLMNKTPTSGVTP